MSILSLINAFFRNTRLLSRLRTSYLNCDCNNIQGTRVTRNKQRKKAREKIEGGTELHTGENE